MPEQFTDQEKALLEPFVSNLDRPIFVLKNLPEVIKGALFSRYSRSTKSLRRLLLDEFIQNPEVGLQEVAKFSKGVGLEQALAIQRAQDFYDRILDGYGDDSIGELGGAHVACEDVSNIAAKVLEDPRIGGSPLEKSSRYVFFDKRGEDGDYLFYKDPHIMESNFADNYLETNRLLFDTYCKLIEPMKKFFTEKIPQTAEVPEQAYKFSIRARSADALRGLLPASTLTNVGIYGNGRFFENLLIKMRSHDLAEMHQIADNTQSELSKVIPSFVRRAATDHKHFAPFKEYFVQTRIAVKQLADDLLKGAKPEARADVELVDYDKDAEDKILTTILYPQSKLSMSQIRQKVKKFSKAQRLKILQEYAGRRTNRRHKPGRAFENAYYTFDILCDFGAFRDLQRHRMLTQERQLLTTDLSFDLPPEIVEAGFEKEWRDCMQAAKNAHEQIAKKMPNEAQYVVPFAYKVRWYFTMNLRAVYWLSELRSIEQGHPNYRKIAQQLYLKVKDVHPSLAEYMKFVDLKDYSLGRLSSEIKKLQKAQAK